MSYLDRVLADSADRASWLTARDPVIGASDAASFSKPTSVDGYIVAKLKSGRFTGNRYTASGNAWEPRILDYYGIPRNTLLVHADGNRHYAATPDGIEIAPDGEILLAEVKTKHGRAVKGPTLAEKRQMWWAQYVLGATRTKFLWVELHDGVPARLEPHVVIVDRDEAQIQKMLAIAAPVLEGVLAAQQFKREVTAA